MEKCSASESGLPDDEHSLYSIYPTNIGWAPVHNKSNLSARDYKMNQTYPQETAI